MDIDPQPEARPEPVTARSLGLFSIIFGTLFILGAAFEAGTVLVLPAFGTLMEWAQAQQQTQLDADRKARSERFEERLGKAGSAEEREEIEAERTLAELNEFQPPNIAGFSMQFLDIPQVRITALIKLGVMTVLGGLMIASGIGLAKLRGWGRSLGRIAAVLMVPAILGFSAASILAAPILAEGWAEEMEAMFNKPGDGPPSEAFLEAMERYEQGVSHLFAVSTAATSLIGVLVPIAVLIIASRPGVHAAMTRPGAHPLA